MSLTGSKLADALAPLGVGRSELVEADKIDAEGVHGNRFFVRVERHGADFSGLADREKQARLSALEADLQGAGHIAVRLGHDTQGDVVLCVGDPPQVDDDPQPPSMDLETFAEEIDAQAGTAYSVEVVVNKTALLARLAGQDVGRDRRLYLFADALSGILGAGSERAAALWVAPGEPIVIAVLDGKDIEARGMLLSIVGGSRVTSGALASLPDGRDASRLWTCRNQHIAWAGKWSRGVTPLHYSVEFTAGGDSVVAKELAGQIAKLTVLHVCDRARIAAPDRPTVVTADFRGGSHAASVQFDDRATSRPWNNEETASLAKLVEWVYRAPTQGARDWMFDRLQFAQITIARMLEIAQSTHASETTLDGFVRISAGLARRLEHQWETYVEGKLDDYAAKVSEVEQEAVDAVSKYNERVVAIVKSVAEAALAAVGVMVGTFIAAAFKRPFNRELFEVGLTVYAWYVLAFPLLWGQASHAYQKRQVTRAHVARLKQLRAVLGSAVDESEVVRTATGASWKFWVWWAVACLVYIGLALAAFVAIDAVPDLVVEVAPVETASVERFW